MEKGISYLNRNFEDYKEALIEFSKKYYPDLATHYDDASVAAWQLDLAADVADNLSYHIDRVYQETNIDTAQERGSLFAIAPFGPASPIALIATSTPELMTPSISPFL